MDTKSLTQSDIVSLATIEESPTKKAVIVSSGMMPDIEGNPKFTLMVDLDGAIKKYKPNKTSLREFQKAWGYESTNWLGKSLLLSSGTVEGKKAIIGKPS